MVFFGVLVHFIPSRRTREIQEILADLELLKADPVHQETAAFIIEFCKAIRFPLSYAWWLIFKAPRLRRKRTKLVELGDLPFPRWQKSILETLSEFEARVPRMLRPIKQGIITELERLKAKKEPILVLSVGCGGMELERQVMYELLRTRFNYPVTFVGIDYSEAVFDIITSKFDSLVSKGLLQIKTASSLGTDALSELKTQSPPQMFSVILLTADAFNLKDLPENSFSLIYHTRLKHHLTPEERSRLDELAIHLAPKVMELDDLFSIPQIILASIVAWRFPAGFSGVIFSYLRDLSKKELLSQKAGDWEVGIFSNPIWCHLKVYKKAVAAG